MGSIVAIAVIGTLAWMQNMYTAPIGIGWKYFAMLMSLALIVPVGLIFFNLIATLKGGALRMRAPLLFAVGALVDDLARPRRRAAAVAGRRRLLPQKHHRLDRRHPLRADRRRRLRRLRRAPLLVPEDDRPHDGRAARPPLLLDARRWARLLAFVPMALAGWEEGQVVDAYKFFNHTGVNFYNLLSSIGVLILFVGVILILINAVASVKGGARAGHDPWKGDTLEWFAALAAAGPQLRRPAGRPQRPAAATTSAPRSPSRAERRRGARGPRVPAGSLTACHPAPARRPRPPRRPG